MRSIPKHFAGRFVERLHRSFAARVQQHIFVEDQARPEVERHRTSPSSRLGTPHSVTRGPVDRDDFRAVVNVNAFRSGGQRQRGDR